MQCFASLLALALVLRAVSEPVNDDAILHTKKSHHHGHHHKGHHHGHHKHHKHAKSTDSKAAAAVKADPAVAAPAVKTKGVAAAAVKPQPVVSAAVQSESSIVEKMRKLEAKLAEKAKKQVTAVSNGHIMVNGPLPVDFNERFAQAVAQSTGTDAKKFHVTDSTPVENSNGVVEVAFKGSPKVVKAVENDAADPESKLAKGTMHSFLVAPSEPEEKDEPAEKSESEEKAAPKKEDAPEEPEQEVTPVQEKGIDIDTAMPYGDLEPFGREDTAQELTESSVKESDEMVDQLERAEVAEEKRAVFRALTRLRGAAITSFDGVARSQTGNIDEYNKIHKWRNTHPLHHLADEESDVTKWAFPDNADF
jgi:hypothetical protein